MHLKSLHNLHQRHRSPFWPTQLLLPYPRPTEGPSCGLVGQGGGGEGGQIRSATTFRGLNRRAAYAPPMRDNLFRRPLTEAHSMLQPMGDQPFQVSNPRKHTGCTTSEGPPFQASNSRMHPGGPPVGVLPRGQTRQHPSGARRACSAQALACGGRPLQKENEIPAQPNKMPKLTPLENDNEET